MSTICIPENCSSCDSILPYHRLFTNGLMVESQGSGGEPTEGPICDEDEPCRFWTINGKFGIDNDAGEK